jgi:putative tryptophan/tyrosine transport system substrate-binding protein
MRRREVITLLSGAAAAWPLAARAQQPAMPLVCILEGISADTPGYKARYAAFLEGLQQLGWTPGRNVRIEVRWGEGDETAIRKHAAELVALVPDVLVAGGGSQAEVALKVTHTIPIVFVIAPDPVGSGLVESLSQPGANATGYTDRRSSVRSSYGGKIITRQFWTFATISAPSCRFRMSALRSLTGVKRARYAQCEFFAF